MMVKCKIHPNGKERLLQAGRNIFFFLFFIFILAACSTTKKLKEGEILYTGVKKMKIETPKKLKLEGPEKSALTTPLSYPPNNPLFSPYVRSPL